MYSFLILVFLVGYIIYRNVRAKGPLYIYKTKLSEDRFIEMLFVLIFLIWTGMRTIEMVTLGTKSFVVDILPFVVSIIVILVLTYFDYNKKKVGLYETGILYKSIFYPWKKIYTFRHEPYGNREKITFFIHKSDPRQLQKNSIYVKQDQKEKMLEILHSKLDITKA